MLASHERTIREAVTLRNSNTAGTETTRSAVGIVQLFMNEYLFASSPPRRTSPLCRLITV